MFAKREFVDVAQSFLFSKAAPKITLGAGRCLVAFLSSFGEQFHDDGRYRRRDIFQSLVRRYRLLSDMAVNPLHGVRRHDCPEGLAGSGGPRAPARRGPVDGPGASPELKREHQLSHG